MEEWALKTYGAAHILQEVLIVKSDDEIGRVKTYEAIVKGEELMEPGVPSAFKVLVKELQALGINVEVLNENAQRIHIAEDTANEVMPELGINLSGLEEKV
jgi:DNA-directed RNA polymerase subunit beta